MNQKIWIIAAVLIISPVVIFSCRKEVNSPESNDNELITTIAFSVTEVGSADTATYTWEDVDGPGGGNPEIDTIRLAGGKDYNFSLTLLDKTKIPFANTTAEIEEESDVHRFYFQPTAETGITVSDPDKDSGGISLGLNNALTTTISGNGSLSITLRQYADGGKAEDDPANSPKSSTDAEAIFPVIVE